MKTLKKLILMAFFFFICLHGANLDVFASECSPLEEDLLPNSSEYEEISALESAILSELHSIGCNGVDSIDFSEAIKIYTDTNIFELGTNDRETILDALQCGDYVWVIFVTSDDINYKITLSIGQPLSENAEDLLTESEKQYIIDNEGKWKVSGISEGTGSDYRTQLSENDEISSYGTDYVIIGGLSGLRMPIVLLFNSDEAVGFAELNFSYPILEDDSTTEIASVVLISDSSSVYDFTSISEASLSYATLYESDASGDDIVFTGAASTTTDSGSAVLSDTDTLSGTQLFFIVSITIIAIVFIAVAIILLWKKRHAAAT